MKLIALLFLLLLPITAHESEQRLEWWEPGEFGACTKTDIRELGGCGKLEVRREPKW